MPRRVSIRTLADRFLDEINRVLAFIGVTSEVASDEQVSWIHDYAIIRLYSEFEHLVLSVITGALNNAPEVASEKLGISLPRHLSADVCEFLITGTGYFDFKGRDGLIKQDFKR
jgi:hypothetical protein